MMEGRWKSCRGCLPPPIAQVWMMARQKNAGGSRRGRSERTGAARPKARSESPIRLQKVLADGGIGSRRYCEELISEGRVEVDRQTVTQLGTRVDPTRNEIRVDGEVLQARRHVYFVLNKPTGVLCTNSDPEGRLRAIDLVPSKERLFTVGRLDRSSEGLLLVTNDGELANRLTHPRFQVSKLYLVRVQGHPTQEELRKLREGIHLAEGLAKVDFIKIRKRQPRHTELEIELREGRNREIRRLLARAGHKVLSLKRIAMGPLRLGELPSGACRLLESSELQSLRRLGRNAGSRPKKGKRPARKGPRTTSSAAASPAPRRTSRGPASAPPRLGSVLVLEGDAESAKPPAKTSAKKKRSRPRRKTKPHR